MLFLGDNEQYLKFAKRLKEYWNVKLVGIVHIAGYNKNIKTYMDETPFDINPFQFLNLIKFAKCILTDSFHCSVFSIHFEKEFLHSNDLVIKILCRLIIVLLHYSR